MKRTGKTKQAGRIIALALTWDGARFPSRSLPPKARAFLRRGKKPSALPTVAEVSSLFAGNGIREIRVCWIPTLKGGEGTLSEPLRTISGKRIPFCAVKTSRFGDVLGVVYRRS